MFARMLPAVRVDRGWQVDKAVLKEFQLAKNQTAKENLKPGMVDVIRQIGLIALLGG